MGTKLDLIIGAQIGHDGFDAPGGGSYFHQLHHAHFECNYGDAAGIPLDWIFGTFEDGSRFSTTEAQEMPTEDKAAPLLDCRDRSITMEEVEKHNSRNDCWIVLNGSVLDVTAFLAEHPGGEHVILEKAGKDATKVFNAIHSKRGGFDLVRQHAPNATIGIVQDFAQVDSSQKDAEQNRSL